MLNRRFRGAREPRTLAATELCVGGPAVQPAFSVPIDSPSPRKPMYFNATCLVGLAFLVGCAAPQRPVMDSQQYSFFASGMEMFNRCGASGKVPVETAAFGAWYMQRWLGAFVYDPVRLQSAMSTTAASPTQEQCNQAAMKAETWRIQVQAESASSAAAQADQAAWVRLINSNRSVNTVCNKIGTQTVCTTN